MDACVANYSIVDEINRAISANMGCSTMAPGDITDGGIRRQDVIYHIHRCSSAFNVDRPSFCDIGLIIAYHVID
jgi:hypothetical protein